MFTEVDLVIFDCDGVLVDSEPISNRIWVECLRELGWTHDLETSHRMFVGRRMDDCVRIAEQELGFAAPATLVPNYRTRSFEAFRRELQPIPGVTVVLESLAVIGKPCCVASSGPHEKIRLNLTITDLLRFFHGRIFSGTDVERGKPHPDLFLHAAERLDVNPERCLVVEDSLPGVEAGLAAGMKVVHFTAGVTPASHTAGQLVQRITHMQELQVAIGPQ